MVDLYIALLLDHLGIDFILSMERRYEKAKNCQFFYATNAIIDQL